MKKLFIVMGLIIGFSHQANAQTSKAIQWEPVESLPSEFSGVWATTGFKLSCDFSSGTPKSGINFLFQDVKNKVEYIFYYQPPGEGHNGVRHGGVRSFTPLRYSNFWRNKQNKNLFLIFYVPSNIYGAYYVGLDGVRKVDILKDGKPYDVFTQSKSNLEEVERWSVDQNSVQKTRSLRRSSCPSDTYAHLLDETFTQLRSGSTKTLKQIIEGL